MKCVWHLQVGGSFGMKGQMYPEYGPTLLSSRLLGRPVKWADERSGSWYPTSMVVIVKHWLKCLPKTARCVGRVHVIAGRISRTRWPIHTRNIVRNFPGIYRLPAMYARAPMLPIQRLSVRTGAPVDQGVYYMERLWAMEELGLDPVELRQRNMIAAELPRPSANSPTTVAISRWWKQGA